MTTPREKDKKSKEISSEQNNQSQKAEIVSKLSTLTEALQDAPSHEEKIELLVKFDGFLKEYKDLIKEYCPDKLVSVLRSL
ncbi:MAG: hypothetical protein ACOC4M_01890 [Promethearchaeia archaeon]